MSAREAIGGRVLSVSVRESRMCVERILLTCGLAPGYVHAVRECILLSEALALGGFRHLLETNAALRMTGFDAMRLEGEGAELALDGAGLHAWIVLPTLVDLAVDAGRRFGGACIEVTGVLHPEELAVAGALGRRHGARIEGGTRMTVAHDALPRTAEQRDPLLRRAMRFGFPVEETLWRAVYALSNTALAPDSVVSRRHAGPVVLREDGTIQGRLPQDDDFDMNMLTRVSG